MVPIILSVSLSGLIKVAQKVGLEPTELAQNFSKPLTSLVLLTLRTVTQPTRLQPCHHSSFSCDDSETHLT